MLVTHIQFFDQGSRGQPPSPLAHASRSLPTRTPPLFFKMHVFYGGAVVRTSLTRRLVREARVKGGVRLFRGSGAAARAYVEADRSRADEYYLGADQAVAEYAVIDRTREVTASRSLSADEYEAWVDWINPDTGESMGTPRKAGKARRGSPLFAEMRSTLPSRCRWPPRSTPTCPMPSTERSRTRRGRFNGSSASTRSRWWGHATSRKSCYRAHADRRHQPQDLACG